jgi:farnesyl-diphosphate farnesyltransferase
MLDLDDLLRKTSRTFALAIPLLPEPTRAEVGIAYLLFRVADTLEDSTRWPRADRVVALGEFARVLGTRDRAAVRALRDAWLANPPIEHAGYMELLERTPELLEALFALDPEAQKILTRHAVRTAEGMADVVTRSDEFGRLRLKSVRELQDYCYIVAGIVGELLTELFLRDAPQLERERTTLEQNTRAFGEGLQLVNILKDAASDATDGRAYLPEGVERADVLRLARENLDAAGRYVTALQRGQAPSGFMAFTGLSVMLARASLDRLEASGAGAKVSREDVFRIFTRLEDALAKGESVQPLLA